MAQVYNVLFLKKKFDWILLFLKDVVFLVNYGARGACECSTYRGQMMAPNALELELQVVVSCPI